MWVGVLKEEGGGGGVSEVWVGGWYLVAFYLDGGVGWRVSVAPCFHLITQVHGVL
jgi:hypothetical protein